MRKFIAASRMTTVEKVLNFENHIASQNSKKPCDLGIISLEKEYFTQ